MSQVGWGIIGCSDIVERRAGAAITAQKDSRLVAFLSRDGERAAAFARKYGAEKAYTDPEAFFQDDAINVVYVANEVDRHAELTIAAANAGKHVLVEKPMALDRAECENMIRAADANGVRLAVAYYARFLEPAQVMKRLIDEGRLGRVVRANIRLIGLYDPSLDDPKHWRVDGNAGGNVLADTGSHRLDMLTYFLGRPIRAMGMADRLTMDYAAADTETGLVQFEGGIHVTVLASANVPHSGDLSTLEVHGSEGSLLADPWSTGPVTIEGDDAPPIPIALPDNHHFPMMDDFARAIATDRPPRFDGVDGMWATAAIEAIYRAAESGTVTDIPLTATAG